MGDIAKPVEMPGRSHAVEKPHPQKSVGFFESTAADFLGAAVTIATGLVTAWVSINNSYFKNAEKYDVIEAERKARDGAWKVLHDSGVTGHTLTDGIQKIEREYSAGVARRLKELGVSYPWQKWHTLRPHQKTEVALSVAAVTAVSIGAIINLASSRRVSLRQDEIEARLDSYSQQRQ